VSVEQEARAAALAAYPGGDAVVIRDEEGGEVVAALYQNSVHAMARTPYAQGYIAGARALVTDAEVDAAARAINPVAWRAYDEPRVDERDLIVEHSRQQARAALEAARAAR